MDALDDSGDVWGSRPWTSVSRVRLHRPVFEASARAAAAEDSWMAKARSYCPRSASTARLQTSFAWAPCWLQALSSTRSKESAYLRQCVVCPSARSVRRREPSTFSEHPTNWRSSGSCAGQARQKFRSSVVRGARACLQGCGHPWLRVGSIVVAPRHQPHTHHRLRPARPVDTVVLCVSTSPNVDRESPGISRFRHHITGKQPIQFC